MKYKTSIEQRIRGWFPQEPNCKNAAPTVEKHRLIKKKALISLSVLALCLLTASVFVVPLILSNGEVDGWVYSKQIDQVSFPGGNIVVYENRQSPQDRGYLTVTVKANVTSRENLAGYVTSRTNALNTLLETATTNYTIEAIITFKDPKSPEDFTSLVETSVEKLGEYAIILTDETTSNKSTEVLWFPRPQEADFTQNITSIKEGYKLEGIIAFECYIKAEAARNLQSDPKVLLIDLLEDLQLLEVKKDYSSKGFDVQFDRPFFKEMWNQCALMKQ